jgi:hypothetical protein
MISKAEARRIAEDFICNELRPPAGDDLVICDVEEFSMCWVATYNSRRFLDTENISCALAGNGPLIINKRAGTIRVGSTSQPVEEQLDRD